MTNYPRKNPRITKTILVLTTGSSRYSRHNVGSKQNKFSERLYLQARQRNKRDSEQSLFTPVHELMSHWGRRSRRSRTGKFPRGAWMKQRRTVCDAAEARRLILAVSCSDTKRERRKVTQRAGQSAPSPWWWHHRVTEQNTKSTLMVSLTFNLIQLQPVHCR